MSAQQLTHSGYEYIMALCVQLKDKRDLEGLTPAIAARSKGYAMKVSQKGHDLLMHNVVLYFQTLADGLAKQNKLEPDEVYITLHKKIDAPRYAAAKRMVEHLCEVLIDDSASASLKALVNNEHVHVSFAGPLIEEIQTLMQKYEALPRKKNSAPKQPRNRNPNWRRDVAKLAASKLVVPKGGVVAGLLRKNETKREATERTKRDAAEERARRTIKEDKLEKTRDQVARNVKVLNYAKKQGVTIRPRVRRAL
jgi:hypothetical protein